LDELTLERLARNQVTFREANQRIVAAAGEIGVRTQSVPFICECADPACTQVLPIDLADYEAVRRNPRRFLHANGHDDGLGEAVELHEDYVVVEKRGLAGEIVDRLARGDG
jgi:hypothetical protein